MHCEEYSRSLPFTILNTKEDNKAEKMLKSCEQCSFLFLESGVEAGVVLQMCRVVVQQYHAVELVVKFLFTGVVLQMCHAGQLWSISG